MSLSAVSVLTSSMYPYDPQMYLYELLRCICVAVQCGVQQRYTNVASLKADLAEVKPDCLVTVPLVLATLHGWGELNHARHVIRHIFG